MALKAAVNATTNNDYVSRMLKVLMHSFTTECPEWGSGIPDRGCKSFICEYMRLR